jgi:hypothetical protein
MDRLNNTIVNKGGSNNTLTAEEWTTTAQKINELVDAANNSGSSSGTPAAIDTNGVVSVNSKGNTTISATKHINIEPVYVSGGGEGTYGDVQIKPGDDITLESHHRALDKRDEITVKTSNGQDGANKAPVKLQVIAADMTLSTKGKTEDSNVMNVNVTTGNSKGYLKVRAQAIDLRCEEHGGIALQPKGQDSSSHMNKIKFEHGGGDGLEFGTFNTEKASIFTDEYRFNREGVWKMATREKLDNTKGLEGTAGVTVGNGKYDPSNDGIDETKHYSYKKQEDDFYDIIANDDEQCTTKDIIKTAYAMNGKTGVHTKITNNGALEIGTSDQYEYIGGDVPGTAEYQETINVPNQQSLPTFVLNKSYSASELKNIVGSSTIAEFETLGDNSLIDLMFHDDYTNELSIAVFRKHSAPNIKIDSGAELKLGGILDFGSSFNFGETDNGIEVQYKLTKKNAEKDCGVLKVVGVNNHATNNLTVEGVTIAPGQTSTIAQCSILDIIKLVNYFKTGAGQANGPWAA